MTTETTASAKEVSKDGLGIQRAVNRVIEALSKDGISKDKKNEQQNYSFRGIDDVYNALAPIIAAAGLNVFPTVKSRECEVRMTAKGTAMYSVVVEADFDFVAVEDGSRETVSTFGEAMDTGDKATNKALSAAYKYACIQTFCIPVRGEHDADKETPEETVPVSNQAPKGLLSSKPSQQSAVESYQEHKAEYAVTVPVLPNGTLDFDAFGADLEIALDGAKTLHDVGMLKKANAKTLNAMKDERPEMFEAMKAAFAKTGNNKA